MSRTRFHLQTNTNIPPSKSLTSPLSPTDITSPTTAAPPTPRVFPNRSAMPTTPPSSPSPSPSPDSPYLDPYTAIAEGYQSRWQSFIAKLSSLKRRKSTSTSSSASSAPQKQPKTVRATLTERNLTQFFNPDYTDVHEAFQERRVNPYNNRGKKERVGEWIRGLP